MALFRCGSGNNNLVNVSDFVEMPSPVSIGSGYRYTITDAKKGDIIIFALWQVYNNSRTYTNAVKLETIYFSQGAGSMWSLVETIQVTDDNPSVTTGQYNSTFESASRYIIISQS